jgi:hypothetical protein
MPKTFKIGEHVRWNSEAGRVSGSRRSESRQAQTLKRGASRSTTDVWHNDQFENGNIRLFGAAPSVALATLGLTVATEGASYAATEARSMMAGAIAFTAYASCVSWVMMRYRLNPLLVTICSIPLWLGAAFGLWYILLK